MTRAMDVAIPPRRKKPLLLRLIAGGLRMAGAIAPGPTSELVRRFVFRPQRGRVRPKEEEVLRRAERTRGVVGGDAVCHYAWGTGERRVLLVHGWSGHAGQLTSFVEPLVAAGWRVIAIDLPAHGESQGKTASVVHFKRAILHAQEIHGPFHGVIGHSLGAAGVALALSEGLGCARVVFFAPVTRFDFIWEHSRRMFGVSQSVIDRTVIRAETWLRVRFDEISAEHLAPARDAELLVVHDKHDPDAPLAGSETLAGLWPKAEIHVTEGLGHVKLLHQPEVIERAVTFLERGPI